MRPTAASPASLLPLVLCVALTAGCRLLGLALPTADGPQTEAAERPRTAAHTIPVELLFVRCDEHDAVLRDELWNFVDEQALGDATRRCLNANGLRVGIVGGHLPPHLADRFVALDAPAGDEFPAASAVTRRLLRLLPGKRSEVVAAARLAELVLLEQCDGEVRGATYHDASPQFAVRVWPASDGRVRLEVVPEVKHGPLEKSWVGEDGMFRLETGQKRHRMEHLRVGTTLPAGALLLIACAGDDAATVGDAMLRDHDRAAGTCVRLLAIRPLAGGTDPMFSTTEDAATDAGDAADTPPAGP
jgi:hypothetical protein